MKKTTYTALLILLLPVLVWAGYYDNVLNLYGDALKNGLRTLISTNTNSSYDNAKLFMFQTADNVNGTVRCIYTGHVYSISGSYNGSSDPNTEHTYAQSWFSSSQSSVKKADVHHLFPSRMQANSARGNLPLANVANHSTAEIFYSNEPWQSYRGGDGFGHTVWEPAPQSKGNVARALMYFYVRYNDPLIQGGVNMLPTLMVWHLEDPVDNAEITRNQAVYSYQNNRNPFVDHPEFVNRIWNPTSADDPLQVPVPQFVINSAYPNPFSASLTLSISSEKSQQLSLQVYNLRGQMIREEELSVAPGESSYIWDGRNASGDEATTGVYFIRAYSPGQESRIRVLKQN